MKDRKFLAWLHERLRYQHGENPNVDYMHRLRSIISAMPDDRDSHWAEMSPKQVTNMAEGFGFNMYKGETTEDQKSTS